MQNSALFFLTLGSILLLGLLTTALARHSFLPRVTLLLLFGALIGPSALDLIPPDFIRYFDIVAEATLLMVGFLLGGKLTKSDIGDFAGAVLWIAITAALVTALGVAGTLAILGLDPVLAITLGCIASATAPAAILDVVEETGSETRFSRQLLAIVAVDDVVALILFAVGIALVQAVDNGHYNLSTLAHAGRELGGALLLGTLIGAPAALLTGRVRSGKPILTEALALVFLCGGLAIAADVSYLVACMVMGAIIANFASHHDYPFHAIEGIESLFMVVFFVLAGASLEFNALAEVGWIGAGFVIARGAGKYLGSWLGAVVSRADTDVRRWMGLAMLPQAGVPIGMALVAANQFPEYRQTLLSVVISATVVFEILGPVLTRKAVQSASQERAPEPAGELSPPP